MKGGILGLFILLADAWAILNIAQSEESTQTKGVWILVVLVFPLFGFAAWYFAGPKSLKL